MPPKRSNPTPLPTQPAPTDEWSFEAIGTGWWIGIYEPIAPDVLGTLKRTIAVRIETFDKTYSRFRTDSLITEIAKKSGSYAFPDDAQPIFDFYRKLYDVSDGLVTPLIGQTLSDAGYDANYSLQPSELRSPPAWDEVMQFHDGVLTTSKPVLLDFGAAGKGYLVDIVGDLLKQHGIKRFCVDAGGDLICHGLEMPLRVGLENPDDTTQVVGIASLADLALCGSAGNRRMWSKYHHIMHPMTLNSPHHIKAVWATAGTTILADGMTTTLFFVDPSKLVDRFDFSYAMIYADGSAVHSDRFPAEIF